MTANPPTPEDAERFLEAVRLGDHPVDAARVLGYTASRFRALAWRDMDFALRYRTARKELYRIRAETHKAERAVRKAELDRLEQADSRAGAAAMSPATAAATVAAPYDWQDDPSVDAVDLEYEAEYRIQAEAERRADLAERDEWEAQARQPAEHEGDA
jgi:hypothetical protein